MSKLVLRIIVLFFAVTAWIPLFAENYVATTLWVKGFADVAGLDNVKTFAPSDMKHPPEYELSPSDILELSKADVVFIAGYEKKMVSKINESFNAHGKKFRIIKVNTENSLQNIEKEAGVIAKEFGTEARYRENIKNLKKHFNEFKNVFELKKVSEKNIYAHSFQVPIVRSFGLEPVATFGPAPISSKEIGEVSKLKSPLIIDNVHNPVGKTLVDANKNAKYASFLNFPGMFGTRTILDIIKYNKEQLEAALK